MIQTNLTVAHKSSGDIKTIEEESLYKILSELPKPERKLNLSRNQKYWWLFFGLEFLHTKQIAKLDLVHLQKAAFWMDARCQAYKEIQEMGYEGLVQTFRSGATNVTGHISIIEKADKHLDDVSAHFGLSIKDRQKLKVEKTDAGQLSLFETVMQKLAQ